MIFVAGVILTMVVVIAVGFVKDFGSFPVVAFAGEDGEEQRGGEKRGEFHRRRM